jgi:hypothetical protein
MPQKVWEDPLLDACGAGASGDDRLYSTSRIARMPVTLEQKSSLTSLKMGTQLVRQRRQDRHVATILLDSGLVPIDQVQKFLGHTHLSTTQIYAQTSLRALGENYIRAPGSKLTLPRSKVLTWFSTAPIVPTWPKFRPSLP